MTTSLPPRTVEIKFRKRDDIAIAEAVEVIRDLAEVTYARDGVALGQPGVTAWIAADVTKRQLRNALLAALELEEVIVSKQYQCESVKV